MTGFRRRLQQLHNAYWERRLHISTRGYAPAAGSDPECVHYGTVSYAAIFAALDHLQLGRHDVFLDLGSGKGRVLCCAGQRALREVIGVECSTDLCEIARQNVARAPLSTPVRIINGPAEEMDYDDVTVFYMFNPFGPTTLGRVLSRIHDSLRRHPRTIRLLYCNPAHECLLVGCSWLHPGARWTPDRHMHIEHICSFWYA